MLVSARYLFLAMIPKVKFSDVDLFYDRYIEQYLFLLFSDNFTLRNSFTRITLFN